MAKRISLSEKDKKFGDALIAKSQLRDFLRPNLQKRRRRPIWTTSASSSATSETTTDTLPVLSSLVTSSSSIPSEGIGSWADLFDLADVGENRSEVGNESLSSTNPGVGSVDAANLVAGTNDNGAIDERGDAGSSVVEANSIGIDGVLSESGADRGASGRDQRAENDRTGIDGNSSNAPSVNRGRRMEDNLEDRRGRGIEGELVIGGGRENSPLPNDDSDGFLVDSDASSLSPLSSVSDVLFDD